jgi:mycothiol synthase
MTNNLPDGYTVRPARMEDLEAAVNLMKAYSLSQIGVEEDSVESLARWWQSPEFQLNSDSIAIFTPQGQMVGYNEFADRGEPHVRLIGWSCVHPEYTGRGLGKYLLEWSIERARQNVAKAPAGTRVVFHHFAPGKNQAAAALFRAAGLTPIRSSYIMRIDFDTPPQPARLPEGITIRPIHGDEEERSAIYAAHESFQDHWGFTNPPFEEYYQRMKHYLSNDPHYDPSLWFIALDETIANHVSAANLVGAITGVSLCSSHMDEDPNLGWVGTLGVRRPWRKRGIGQALLQHSFDELYRRGKNCAGLGVDAGSLTGAVRLYEKAGMHVLRKMDIFELELRPGKELMTQTIDEPSTIEEK